MNRNPIAIIIVLLVVVVGGWYLLSGTPAEQPGTEGVSNQMPAGDSTVPETVVEDEGVTVTYTDEGFSPKSVTVPLGTKVTFVKETSKQMWVGSAMHPSHEVYDGTSTNEHCVAGYAGSPPFDQCADGDRYTFVFTKPGTWNYHNHLVAGNFGSVVVTP